MTIDQFNKKLREFLSEVCPLNNELESTEVNIELQPGMISFGGHFTLRNGEEMPIDLQGIGKYKCNNLRQDIQSLHRLTTNHGHDKWNKASYKSNNNGNVEWQFIWDVQFEKIHKQSYSDNEELTRQKWYWEEK